MKTLINILKNPLQVASIAMVAFAAITILALMAKVKVAIYMFPAALAFMIIYTLVYCFISMVVCFNEEDKNKDE